MAPGGVFEDTPHEGRTEWQFWGPSGAVPHLWRAGLWSPSTPWPFAEYASFDVATLAEWAGRLCQEWGLLWWYPWVWLSRSCWRQCSWLSYPVWFPQKLVRGTCSVHLRAAFPSLVCIWWSRRIAVTAGTFAGVGGGTGKALLVYHFQWLMIGLHCKWPSQHIGVEPIDKRIQWQGALFRCLRTWSQCLWGSCWRMQLAGHPVEGTHQVPLWEASAWTVTGFLRS